MFNRNGTVASDGLVVTVSCDLDQQLNGDYEFDLLLQTEDYSLRIRDALIPSTGGDVGGDCQVEFTDNVRSYRGACGAGPVNSLLQPCRLSAVGLGWDDRIDGLQPGPTLTTSLICDGIQATDTRTVTRDLYAPMEAGQPDSPAPITVVNCVGHPSGPDREL